MNAALRMREEPCNPIFDTEPPTKELWKKDTKYTYESNWGLFSWQNKKALIRTFADTFFPNIRPANQKNTIYSCPTFNRNPAEEILDLDLITWIACLMSFAIPAL